MHKCRCAYDLSGSDLRGRHRAFPCFALSAPATSRRHESKAFKDYPCYPRAAGASSRRNQQPRREEATEEGPWGNKGFKGCLVHLHAKPWHELRRELTTLTLTPLLGLQGESWSGVAGSPAEHWRSSPKPAAKCGRRSFWCWVFKEISVTM